jgi:hypothetical protein
MPDSDPPTGKPSTVAPSQAAPVSDGGWPKSAENGTKVFTVYQPQLDAWDGNKLEIHAAVAVGEKGGETQTFGVVWVTARTLVNKDSQLVKLEDIQIVKVNFPSTSDEGAEYRTALQKCLPPKTDVISLPRLEADLAILKALEKGAAVPIKNEPPRIVFMKKPAILLFIDGQPVQRQAGCEVAVGVAGKGDHGKLLRNASRFRRHARPGKGFRASLPCYNGRKARPQRPPPNPLLGKEGERQRPLPGWIFRDRREV